MVPKIFFKKCVKVIDDRFSEVPSGYPIYVSEIYSKLRNEEFATQDYVQEVFEYLLGKGTVKKHPVERDAYYRGEKPHLFDRVKDLSDDSVFHKDIRETLFEQKQKSMRD